MSIAAARVLLANRWLHNAVLSLLIGLAWIRGSHWKASAEAWEVAHQKQVELITGAEQAALAKAALQRAETEQLTATFSRRSDDAENALSAYRRASDRFASARRMPIACVAGTSGEPTTAPPGDPAEGGDRHGADALVLTRPEYDELIENSLRLERVRIWGQSLIKAGLAVPEVEFGAGQRDLSSSR